jgi:hypothetical protein
MTQLQLKNFNFREQQKILFFQNRKKKEKKMILPYPIFSNLEAAVVNAFSI